MTEIKLRDVQIIWNPEQPGLPPAALVWKPEIEDRRYDCSWGCCSSDFNEASDEERINMLFRQFVHMTAIEGIDARVLHDIFMDIPEWRQALADFGSIDPQTV